MSSEVRWCPLSKTWVLVSENRNKRPHGDAGVCVFCPGNEHLTPPTILRVPEGGPWQVRVMANKFNALAIEPQLQRTGVGVYLKDNGVGAHEVIIDHPHGDHRHPADLTIDEWVLILKASQARMIDLVRDKRFIYPVWFKNQGVIAGQSIPHPHSQLMVLPIVPTRVEAALYACRQYFLDNRNCLICQIVDDELKAKERVVWENNSIVAWSYYTARFPYEVRLAPKREFHQHRFEWSGDERIRDLAEVFSVLLRKMRIATNDAPFNITLWTSPWFENDARPSHGATIKHDFHWHFEISPRLTKLAGFELATGFYINPKSPEIAADELRNAII